MFLEFDIVLVLPRFLFEGQLPEVQAQYKVTPLRPYPGTPEPETLLVLLGRFLRVHVHPSDGRHVSRTHECVKPFPCSEIPGLLVLVLVLGW